MVRLGQLFPFLRICSMKTVAGLADVKVTDDAPVGERVNKVLVVRLILYCTDTTIRWQWSGQVNRALLKNVDFFMEGYSGGKACKESVSSALQGFSCIKVSFLN